MAQASISVSANGKSLNVAGEIQDDVALDLLKRVSDLVLTAPDVGTPELVTGV